MSPHPASNIILPLYIYPHPGAWDPLFTAISKQPHLECLVIINPNSGPGTAPWWPNEDYVREIPRLNALSNVKTLGYVCATYCKRSLGNICQDIEVYAHRGRKAEGLQVDGIFVDETVNLYSKEAKRYLDGIDDQVRCGDAFSGKRMVVHNPGTAVSAELATPGPDITVVVETSYEHFITSEYQDWLSTSPYDRSRSAYMVHSVPKIQVKGLTKALRERAGYLFVTSASCGFYESFGASWEDFVMAMVEQ